MNSRLVYPTFLRDCFSVETPITNRNNGCLWEGSKEKIAIASEAGFNLENPKVNQSKKEQDNFYSHKIESCTVTDSMMAWVEDVHNLLVTENVQNTR